jgi:hypothetical protein
MGDIRKIARLITEDPDVLNEGWEELGIEDPYKGMRRIIVTDYALHPLDFSGAERHITSRDMSSLAAFDRDFSLSLLDLPKTKWETTLAKSFADFTNDAGAKIDLNDIHIIDRDVKFHTTSGETFATNPLAHMSFTALVDEEEWLTTLQALDRVYGEHGINWKWA